jgi:hypothetical protein
LYEAPKGKPEAPDYRRSNRSGNNPERIFCGTLLSGAGEGMSYAGFHEEGDACKECREGFLVFLKVENCSCHISPPCGPCTNQRLECNSCDWRDETEEQFHDIECAPGLAIREFRPRPLDPAKIDYRNKMHSSSSMIKEGVYPEGTTIKEVESVVRGTFGGRFESFADGKFRYIAYTD